MPAGSSGVAGASGAPALEEECEQEDNGGCHRATLCLGSLQSPACTPCPEGFSGDGETGCTKIRDWKSIAAGNYVCGLHMDGTIECLSGITPPEGVFERLIMGFASGCALDSAGEATCFSAPFPPPSSLPGPWMDLAVGSNFACGLRSDASVECWPLRLGVISQVDITPPDVEFIAISAYDQAVCGITTDGEIECWGDIQPPSEIPAGPFDQLSVGISCQCALRPDGTAACFGSSCPELNGSYVAIDVASDHGCGLLADGSVECHDRGEPLEPPFGVFEQIAVGWPICGLRTDGSLACWDYPVPYPPVGPSDSALIDTGDAHTCFVNNGTLLCWGDNTLGQLDAPAGDTFVQVAAGAHHNCALAASGELSCWGDNATGQASPPTGEHSWVAAGGDQSCAIGKDNVLRCWGADTASWTLPSERLIEISVGGSHACGMYQDRSLVCFGSNDFGQASPPFGSFQSLSAGLTHSCGVRASGKLLCWGDDAHGKATPPVGTFVEASAGDQHSCAVDLTQRATCWGDNSFNQALQLDRDLVYVAAGARHTCGVSPALNTPCWGSNTEGQIDRP